MHLNGVIVQMTRNKLNQPHSVLMPTYSGSEAETYQLREHLRGQNQMSGTISETVRQRERIDHL